MRHTCFSSVCTAFLLAFSLPTFATAATFKSIGAFEPTAISADGTTVVGITISGNKPVRWKMLSGLLDLDGLSLAFPTGISADGSVVVGTFSPAEFQRGVWGSGAFRWSSSEGVIRIPGMNQAAGVSADGKVLAGDDSLGGPNAHAKRWTVDTGTVDLDATGNWIVSHVSGISPDGGMVLGARSIDGDGGPSVWAAPPRMSGLAAGPGEPFRRHPRGFVMAASFDGSTIVGWELYYSDTHLGFTGGDRSYLATRLGSIFIDPLYGPTDSRPSAISADGSIVVGAYNRQSDPTAYIWRADTGRRDLADVLTGLGIDLTGWNLTSAVGISADGTVLVGAGISPGGQPEAWLAVIPEPSSLALLFLTPALLLTRQRVHGGHRA